MLGEGQSHLGLHIELPMEPRGHSTKVRPSPTLEKEAPNGWGSRWAVSTSLGQRQTQSGSQPVLYKLFGLRQVSEARLCLFCKIGIVWSC